MVYDFLEAARNAYADALEAERQAEERRTAEEEETRRRTIGQYRDLLAERLRAWGVEDADEGIETDYEAGVWEANSYQPDNCPRLRLALPRSVDIQHTDQRLWLAMLVFDPDRGYWVWTSDTTDLASMVSVLYYTGHRDVIDGEGKR